MRSGIWSVATTRIGCLNLIYMTLWTVARSGLLILILKILNSFRLTSLITLVLLKWKRMGLFLRKKSSGYRGCLSFLNRTGTLTLSLLLKNVNFFKKNFMATFYRWGSTGSMVEPLRGGSLLFTTKFLVIILSTSKGWRAESNLEPPSGFEHRTPGLGIQRLNH